MKTLSLFAVLMIGIFNNSFGQSSIQKDSIKVWGNCGMCKKKIEKAAKSAGAQTASWNEESKMLKVSYTVAKTSLQKIQQSVANAGYDTQDLNGDDKAYEKLPACCHYDRKEEKSITPISNHK